MNDASNGFELWLEGREGVGNHVSNIPPSVHAEIRFGGRFFMFLLIFWCFIQIPTRLAEKYLFQSSVRIPSLMTVKCHKMSILALLVAFIIPT